MKMLKKIIAVCMVSVLIIASCACQKKTAEGSRLCDIFGVERLSDLENNMPNDIGVYNDFMAMGQIFSGDEEKSGIIDAFENLTVGKKLENVDFFSSYELQFYWDDDFCGIYMTDDAVEIYSNDDVSYYELFGIEELLSWMDQNMTGDIGGNPNAIPVASLNGLDVNINDSYVKDNGDVSVELQIDNSSEKSYEVAIRNCFVNDVPVQSYQSLISMAGQSTGYYASIYSSTLQLFGMNEIAGAEFVVEVYEYDDSTNETGNLVYTSDPVELSFGEFDPVSNALTVGNPLYSNDGISVYSVMHDEGMYSSLRMIMVNDNDVSVKITPVSVTMNYGTEQSRKVEDADYSFLSCDVPANDCMAALLPVMNYIYDEAKGTTETIPLENAGVEFKYEIDGKTYTTDILMQ